MFSLIFFIAFPFLMWSEWRKHQTAKASASWPTTEGTITKVERFKRLFRWLPRVAYNYSVDGKPYSSARISFAAGYRPREVEAVLSRYSVGQSVRVSHSPTAPNEAVLEPGSGPHVTATMRVLVTCFILLLILNAVQFFVRAQEL